MLSDRQTALNLNKVNDLGFKRRNMKFNTVQRRRSHMLHCVVPCPLLPQNLVLHILQKNEEIITYLRANQTIDSWESWFSLFTLHVQQRSTY